jgi:hypothetical protein
MTSDPDLQAGIPFNRGSDARLAGVPLKANPYLGASAVDWRRGWMHVDKEWGADARKHRQVVRLPVVEGCPQN